VTGRRRTNRSTTLGDPATHSPDGARTEANRLKGQAQAGEAPVAERKAQAAKGRRQRGTILRALADAYGRAMPRRQKDSGTWHDFRRSFATALGEAGVSEAVVDAVLNHRQSATRGVLGVCQRASRWPERVKTMEHWGTAAGGRPQSE
jgi:hypothetical protein